MGSPNAISPMLSAVKYWIFWARSKAFVSVGADRYDVSMSLMSAAIFVSILLSRPTMSRPEYLRYICQRAEYRAPRRGTGILTPGASFIFLSPCTSLSRSHPIWSRSGLNLKAMYQMFRLYLDRGAAILRASSTSEVRRTPGATTAIVPDCFLAALNVQKDVTPYHRIY